MGVQSRRVPQARGVARILSPENTFVNKAE
jgi:hypothetical protein